MKFKIGDKNDNIFVKVISLEFFKAELAFFKYVELFETKVLNGFNNNIQNLLLYNSYSLICYLTSIR